MKYWYTDKTHEITDDSSSNGDTLADAKSWKEKFDQDLQKELEQKAQDAKLQNGNFFINWFQTCYWKAFTTCMQHLWYSLFWNALISIEARKLKIYRFHIECILTKIYCMSVFIWNRVDYKSMKAASTEKSGWFVILHDVILIWGYTIDDTFILHDTGPSCSYILQKMFALRKKQQDMKKESKSKIKDLGLC